MESVIHVVHTRKINKERRTRLWIPVELFETDFEEDSRSAPSSARTTETTLNSFLLVLVRHLLLLAMHLLLLAWHLLLVVTKSYSSAPGCRRYAWDLRCEASPPPAERDAARCGKHPASASKARPGCPNALYRCLFEDDSG